MVKSKEDKKICVVIPVRNRLELTKRFLESFSKVTYKNYTIVIIDDASTDGTPEYIKKHHPEVVVLMGNGDLWWSGGTNVGVRYALKNDFDYVLTINNDSRVHPEILNQMLQTSAENPKAIIGALVMINLSKDIWSVGVNVDFRKFPFLQLNHSLEKIHEIDNLPKIHETKALAGNGVLIPIDVFRKIGLYDEVWCPQYHGDTEFTYRATRNGYKCLVNTEAIVYNGSATAYDFNVSKALFSKKSNYYWKPIVKFYFSHVPWKDKIFIYRQFSWALYRVRDVIKLRLRF